MSYRPNAFGSYCATGSGPVCQARGIVGERLRWIVAPRKLILLETTPGGAFPFGLSGEAETVSGLLSQPFAITQCFMPRRSRDRLLRMIELGITPERGRRGSRRGKESRVLFVGDLRGGEQKCVDGHAMDRSFAILALLGAHQETGHRDSDEGGWLGVLRVSDRFRVG